MRLFLSLWGFFWTLTGCETLVRPITQRPLQGIRAAQERKNPKKDSPDLFTRKRELLIEPIQNENVTGSLIQPDDEKNYLFTSRIPTQVGAYIPVELDSLRIKSKDDKADKKDTNEPDIQEALLKEFPTLAPPDGEDKHLLRSIKMRISDSYDNGDLLVTYKSPLS